MCNLQKSAPPSIGPAFVKNESGKCDADAGTWGGICWVPRLMISHIKSPKDVMPTTQSVHMKQRTHRTIWDLPAKSKAARKKCCFLHAPN